MTHDATDPARNRFLIISLVRIVGAIIAGIGLLALAGAIAIPDWGAALLLIFGLFDLFFFPQILARRWRTPLEDETAKGP